MCLSSSLAPLWTNNHLLSQGKSDWLYRPLNRAVAEETCCSTWGNNTEQGIHLEVGLSASVSLFWIKWGLKGLSRLNASLSINYWVNLFYETLGSTLSSEFPHFHEKFSLQQAWSFFFFQSETPAKILVHLFNINYSFFPQVRRDAVSILLHRNFSRKDKAYSRSLAKAQYCWEA